MNKQEQQGPQTHEEWIKYWQCGSEVESLHFLNHLLAERQQQYLTAWGMLYEHQWWMADHKEVFELNAQLQLRVGQLASKLEQYIGMGRAMIRLRQEVVDVVSKCKIKGLHVVNDPMEQRRAALVEACRMTAPAGVEPH